MFKWYLCIYIFSLSILNVFRKRNCIWIRKTEDRVLNPVRPSGRVRYGGAGRHIFSGIRA